MRHRKKLKRETDAKAKIQYAGKVTVEVVKDGKVLQTINTHNTGDAPLFKFLAFCLASTYYGEDAPRYIRTFNSGTGKVVETTTTAIPYNNTLFPTPGENSSYSLTMSFLIPFSSIKNDIATNEVRIYSTAEKDNLENPSAHFTLDAPVTPDDNANLNIKWQMIIGNTGD